MEKKHSLELRIGPIPAFEKEPLQPVFYKELFRFFHPGNYYYFFLDCDENRIEFLSPEVKTTLGVKNQIGYESLVQRIHPDDCPFFFEYRRKFDEFFSALAAEKKQFYKLSFDVRIQSLNGRFLRILHQEVPVHYDDNRIFKSLCIHTDISALKRTGMPEINFMGMNGAQSFCYDELSHRADPAAERLTNKETEVLNLILMGKKSKEIADILGISIYTVNNHRKNILRKCRCRTPQELIIKYSR